MPLKGECSSFGFSRSRPSSVILSSKGNETISTLDNAKYVPNKMDFSKRLSLNGSGQGAVNRFGFRGPTVSSKAKVCDKKDLSGGSDPAPPSRNTIKSAPVCKNYEKVIRQPQRGANNFSGLKNNVTDKTPKQAYSHLPRPQFVATNKKIQDKNYKTVTNTQVKTRLVSSAPVNRTKTYCRKGFQLKVPNTAPRSAGIVSNRYKQSENTSPQNFEDIEEVVQITRAVHAKSENGVLNKIPEMKQVTKQNTGFSSDEEEISEISEMHEDRKTDYEKDGSPQSQCEDVWGRGEDLAVDELDTAGPADAPLRDVLLEIEDTSFAPLAILSMPETCFHIEDESFPDVSVAQPPPKLDETPERSDKDPGSPRSQRTNSGSFCSDGRDFFDDEISDQPFLLFDNTPPNSYVPEVTEASGSVNSSYLEDKPDIELLMTIKQKIGITRRQDEMSGYDSIRSDDLMLNYERDETDGPMSLESQGMRHDDVPDQSAKSLDTDAEDSENPREILQDIKSTLHQLIDVLSLDDATKTVAEDDDTESVDFVAVSEY